MAKTSARRKRWLPPLTGRGRIGGRIVWGPWLLAVGVIVWFQVALRLLVRTGREATGYELPLAG